MKDTQLNKGIEIREELEKKRNSLYSIKHGMKGRLSFTVSDDYDKTETIWIDETAKYTGFDKEIQTFLCSAKQTLILLMENEIKRLEKEWEDL